MINDKRICQLMLPCYILFDLARNSDDSRSTRAISEHVSKTMGIFLNYDLKRMRKLSIRIGRIVQKINWYCADAKGFISGHQMVLNCFFLTQLIFDEKDGNISDKVLEVAKRTERLVRFVISFETKNRTNEDRKDWDYNAMEAFAEVKAKEIFEKFYLTI